MASSRSRRRSGDGCGSRESPGNPGGPEIPAGHRRSGVRRAVPAGECGALPLLRAVHAGHDAGEHIRVRARRHAMTEVDDMSVRGGSRLQAGIHGRRQDLPGGGQEGRVEIALDDDGRPVPVPVRMLVLLSIAPPPVVGAQLVDGPRQIRAVIDPDGASRRRLPRTACPSGSGRARAEVQQRDAPADSGRDRLAGDVQRQR